MQNTMWKLGPITNTHIYEYLLR